MKARATILLLVLTGMSHTVVSQNLLDILEDEQQDIPQYTQATFKFSRIAFGHSIETRKKGLLDIFVANRFWNTPEERTQSFAADRLSTRIALEYGISDKFLVGVGGTTFDGLFDGFVKYKLVQQRSDQKGSPISITLLQSTSYFSETLASPNIEDDFSHRLSFTSQMLIGKKITPNFSLQMVPTFVHRGLVLSNEDPQNHFAIGFGGRYKLGNHVSVVSEYYYTANPIKSFDTYGPFALGVNWEIGDVMLQFMLTNAVRMVEDAYITRTRHNFNFRNPNLNFGFNMTYVIHFKRKLKNVTDGKH
ncbi:DUF5777 family beta-barrel protein [Flagellimonas lutaonensis]|uniref:DUF5777 domain-containing protein n=1 Tax=Flagellimonas lutaonensis TaxID=516051 RepID=A0A0D5YW09_9FLAO|nr:DUF5777 family beta-barrel protein [Allomuricauda lutaonensis]AKA36512.1 hypothetical protein VC82_2968 [Allomuricauda lutaonensis]